MVSTRSAAAAAAAAPSPPPPATHAAPPPPPSHASADAATNGNAQPAAASASATATTTSTAANAPRYAYARAVLGAHTFHRIASANLLVVGAGGIGCELLKNLVLVGFGNIQIVDLDTIDLSNLNRQFLFQKQHIKKSKSIVAKQTASGFNPLVNIVAHHANIKEPRFGVAYFQRFDIVLNALDNLEARRWVNRMCIAANVPLVESGTTGFLGQVQPILKDVTECYDCTAKPVPKTYPVCTIRSTPSTSIHCIVWAKSWLFTQLFGADDETEEEELDKAVADGQDANEIDTLRKEAREMRDIRTAMFKAAELDEETQHRGEALQEVAQRVFTKVFRDDVLRLLGMEEMWKHRPVKPVPLDYYEATFHREKLDVADGAGAGLFGQRKLSLADNVRAFCSSLHQLAVQAAENPSVPLTFDKDDEEALEFVTSASNLRAHIYSIETKTRFEVKEMAGNIIPAIASTNAIIAGQLVVQALHMLRSRWNDDGNAGVGESKYVSLARTSQRMLTAISPAPPNENCAVCRDVYVPLCIDPSAVTLGALIEGFVRLPRSKGGLGMEEEELETYEGTRLLSDPDFEDNLESLLEKLGVDIGKMLSIVDEQGQWTNVSIVLEPLKHGENNFILPEKVKVPQLKKKFVKQESIKSQEESEDDDEIVEVREEDISSKKRALEDGRKQPTEIKRKRNDEAVPDETKVKKSKTIDEAGGGGGTEMEAIELD